MLDQLLRLLKGHEAPHAAPSDEELRIAVAALLVEAARMDESFGDDERATAADLLAKRFALSDAEVASLVQRADERMSRSAQYFPFVHNINQMMSATEKAEVIEMLWRIAYADGTLDAHEDQLIRQVAGHSRTGS